MVKASQLFLSNKKVGEWFFSHNSLFCGYLIPEDVWHHATLSAGSCTISTHSYISCFAVFNELRSIPCNPRCLGKSPEVYRGKPPCSRHQKPPVRHRWDLQIGEGWQCRERIGDIQDHAVPREAIASWEKWRGASRRCHQAGWLADVLQKLIMLLFLECYTSRCRTVHGDKESSWKIPSNSGVCRGWLHFTNPKSGQFGRFPNSNTHLFWGIPPTNSNASQFLQTFMKQTVQRWVRKSFKISQLPPSIDDDQETQHLGLALGRFGIWRGRNS